MSDRITCSLQKIALGCTRIRQQRSNRTFCSFHKQKSSRWLRDAKGLSPMYKAVRVYILFSPADDVNLGGIKKLDPLLSADLL